MTCKEAESASEAAELKPEIEEKYSDTLAEGHVLSKEPSSGALYRGDKVTIVVSRGPEKVAVANVLGKNVDEATKELEDLGFEGKPRQMHDSWIWGERVSERSEERRVGR